MSLSGSGTVIQVNGANFTVADATKELRANLIRFSTTSSGLSLSSLNGNVYTSSNISAGYYHGNAKHLVSISDAAAGTYGGADAVVASVVVDSTGRITGISNVNIELDDVLKHGNTTSNTVQFTNAGVSLKATGEVNAGSFVGDGSGLSGLTGAGAATYGSETESAAIVVNSDGRITGITNKTITRDTFSNVVARGASTANVVTFSNVGRAVMVTDNAGMIAIANSAPSKSFSVGNKFVVDRNATGSNKTVSVTGNVSASYYYGNAKHLVSTTDVSDGTYGSSTAIPTVTVTNGRVASIGTNSIDVTLQGVSDTGNTTSNTLQFTNSGTSLITSGKVGIANSAPGHSLAVADAFYVRSDGGTVASYFSGDGANVTNIVGSSTVKGVTHGGTSSVPTIQIDSDGKITQIANVDIAQNLQDVTVEGATSNQTITLTNSTSLQAQGKVAVSTSSAPTHDFHVGDNFYVDDDGTNKVVVTGRVSATDYVGDGGLLSNLSELTSSSGDGADGVFGSTSKVPVITFDDNGRISAMSTVDVQSNVNSGTTNQLAFYTSATQVAGFSALTKDGSNMTLQGTFTTEDIFVNGNLHVTGNTVVHDHIVIEDPILTIGNVSEATTQSVGTVFSRSDANVAMFYNKSTDGQAANKLSFGFTSNTGVGADIIIDSTRILESRFYGNVEATCNITATDTITATSFVGSGAQLTSIDFGAVDNNAETRLATAETDIDNLETSNGLAWSNITTIISDVSSNAGILSTLKTDHENNVSRINTLITDLDAAEVDIDNLETSNGLAWSNITTIISDVSSNAGILSTLKTDHEDNVSRINTLVTKTTDISFSSSQTTVAGDLIVGAAGTFFVDQSTGKVGISNASAAYELAIGTNFYVDATNDVVSTIGSTLNTGTVEVVGDSSTVDFKTGTGENADCRIAKSSDGLVISTGGDGSLATSLTLYSNTDARFESNIEIGGELNVANLVTSNIVFSSSASVQAAQISLDDVVAVSGTTTRAVTVGDLNATGTVSAAVKNFDIPHPVVEGKRLIHACIETARADNIYMGSVVLTDGKAEIDLDSVNGMTSGTFQALHKNVRVFTTNESDWDAVKGKVDSSILSIACQNGASNAVVSWLVAGTRTDIPDVVVEV